MEMKKVMKIFRVIILCIVVITLLLSIFYNVAFITSCMLMGSLYLFSLCYSIKDSKKDLMYILFILGVLLMFASLGYTFMRVING